MELSIIVVNYKTPDLVADCVASIKKNTLVGYEIIIVENGSGDDSEGKLKKLTSDNTHLVVSSKNLGFAAGNNLGIKKAKGKYILLLNSDTIVEKSAIDELYKFAVKTKDAGAIGAKLLNSDGTTQGSVFRSPSVGLAIGQYWLGQKGLMDKYAPSGADPVEVDSLVMAAFLITPRAIKKVGLLDERYFMFYEDLDYCRRIIKSGLKNYYLPVARVVHLHGASGKRVRADKDQWKRLIPSSKLYHGALKHYLITFIMWTGQKWQNYLKN